MASHKRRLRARSEIHSLRRPQIRVDLNFSRTQPVLLSRMELDAPVGLEHLVLRLLARLAEPQPPDQLGLRSHLVQALKIFAQRLLRLAANNIGHGSDQLEVALLQVHVEAARHQDRVADLEEPHLGIAEQLRYDVIAGDLACRESQSCCLITPE